MGKTLFQRIIDRELPAKILYDDEHCIAIEDIRPKAPVHVLIIPKKPIPRVADAADTDEGALGHLLLVARDVARSLKLDGGFRIVINNGPDAGESIPHLHLHLLGRRRMGWPPG